MKVYNVTAFDGYGLLEMHGDGSKLNISLTSSEAARFLSLAREIFLERQKALVAEVQTIPPSNQLEAPEYTEFEPVREKHDDDFPF